LDPHLVLGGAYTGSALFIVAMAMGAGEPWILMPATFLAGFGVVGAQMGMNALAAGMYPTAIRSTGIGWALGVGRIGSIIGPLVSYWGPAGTRNRCPRCCGAGTVGGGGSVRLARPWTTPGRPAVRDDPPALRSQHCHLIGENTN
jgi:hypothetical protein